MNEPTEDELRAEQYQRTMAARRANQAALDAKLHGSAAARRQLEIDWRPLEEWLLEREQNQQEYGDAA